MRKYKGVYVIGTSHIANESVKEVEQVIREVKPGVVALELDRKRYHVLMAGKKHQVQLRDIGKVGVKGFLFNVVGAWVERKLSKVTGSAPGSEMKRAAECAREVGAAVAVIDQDIEVTLRKLSARMTTREKLRMGGDVIRGMLGEKGGKKIDLRKVPSERVIEEMTNKVKRRYPAVYQVIVEERNEIMGKALYKLMQMKEGEKVVAVVGAGHEKDVVEEIKKEDKRKRGEHLKK